jgi:hypothetical protein
MALASSMSARSPAGRAAHAVGDFLEAGGQPAPVLQPIIPSYASGICVTIHS